MVNNFLFIGYLLPDDEMNEIIKLDKYPQIQTHKFIKNLVRGIEEDETCDFTYLSTRPVSDYPHYKKKLVPRKRWSYKLDSKRIDINEIPFINISILKIVSRFIASFIEAINVFNNKKNKQGVIVYSVHVPFMLVGFLISRLYKIDFITIWTDPPSVKSHRDGLIKNYLRNIEYSISKTLMKHSKKTIVLTEQLAQDFAPETPYLVIEGIIDENERKEISIQKEANKIFKVVYTGSVERRYGIENIVEAFKKMNNLEISLEIYGKGDFEEQLKSVSKEYENIKYMGFVSNDEVLKIQRNADLLINARPVTEDYTKYSFPSKTLEYMLSGVPLLTTELPGIPQEYFNYVYSISNNEVDTIIKKIKQILNLSEADREKRAKEAVKFAKTKNFDIQGRKIMKFINK